VEQIGGREQAPYDIRSVAPNDLTLALKWPDLILNRAPLGGGQFGESLSMFVHLNAALCGVVIAVACSSAARAESGIASIYAYAGEKTANGERAQPGGLTAAHRTLPFGTRVRVTNKRNGHTVIVRINDRGPFVKGRVIDLTPAAARVLGFSGLAPVAVARTQS
jgi:rare lipoprotein A